jgi:hypothetical protein
MSVDAQFNVASHCGLEPRKRSNHGRFLGAVIAHEQKQQTAPDAVAEVGAGMVIDDLNSICQIVDDFNWRIDRARNARAARHAADDDHAVVDNDAGAAHNELPRRVPVGRENLNRPVHPEFSPVESITCHGTHESLVIPIFNTSMRLLLCGRMTLSPFGAI